MLHGISSTVTSGVGIVASNWSGSSDIPVQSSPSTGWQGLSPLLGAQVTSLVDDQ